MHLAILIDVALHVIQAQPIDLADNMPGSLWTFTLGVFTGTRVGAGTTANICVKIMGNVASLFSPLLCQFGVTSMNSLFVLLGNRGESDVHMLASRDFSVCQRGDVTVFLLRCAYDVGEVTSVRLWHDSSGDGPSW